MLSACSPFRGPCWATPYISLLSWACGRGAALGLRPQCFAVGSPPKGLLASIFNCWPDVQESFTCVLGPAPLSCPCEAWKQKAGGLAVPAHLWLCHLPALGSQATDRASLRLSPWVRWASMSKHRILAARVSATLASATLALAMSVLFFGGGALRSWLWHPGPRNPEILVRGCLREAPGMQQGSEQRRDPCLRGITAVQRQSPCVQCMHRKTWKEAGPRTTAQSHAGLGPGCSRGETPPLGRREPGRVLSFAFAWPQI